MNYTINEITNAKIELMTSDIEKFKTSVSLISDDNIMQAVLEAKSEQEDALQKTLDYNPNMNYDDMIELWTNQAFVANLEHHNNDALQNFVTAASLYLIVGKEILLKSIPIIK